MQESKLIETFKILTNEEISEIRVLLRSEWIIKGIPQKEALLLFNYILKFYDDWENENLSKEIALKSLFGKKQDSINKIAKVMTSLMQVVEYYIANYIVKKEFSDLKFNLGLANFYKLRGLPQRSEIFIKRAGDFFNTHQGMSIDFHLFYSEYLETNLYTSDDYKKNNISLSKIVKQNKAIELLKNLELICNLVYPKIYLDDETKSIFDEIDTFLQQHPDFREIALIEFYYLAILMAKNINDDNTDYYEAYKKNLQKIESNEEQENYKTFFSIERSYLIKRYNNRPDENSLTLLFLMYKEQLEKGYLLIQGILPKGVALNIISFSVKKRDKEAILALLNNWKNQIGTIKERAEILNFGWANYYFLNEDYEKANGYISISYLDMDFIINTRRMRIKILYEQNESIMLSYELDAFKIFVFRQYKKGELSENKYIINNHFVDLLKKISNLKTNCNFKKKETLLKKVQEQKCADKEWLLEKIHLY